ncbi:MAG: hypothetical protein ACI9FU_001227 [Granulosicoccus sp.]|jgi:hypothetical protein
MPYVGYIDHNEWYHDFNFTDHLSARYNYLKVGDMVCGNYAMVGIEESSKSNSPILYPNPASHQFTLTSSLNSFQQLSVYNSQGNLVFQDVINTPTTQVDCSTWPTGLYLIIAETEEGRMQQKLLVQ